MGVRFAQAVVAVVVASMACAGAQPPGRGRQTRILFIGNSLTATNGLPAMLEALGAAAGESLACTSIAYPNFSLEDHWASGDARQSIQRGGWSVVVLQQGPSALPESRTLLREYVRRFDGEIVAAGARTAIYMVWPSRARSGDFDEVRRSYTLAAADVRGLLLPAGDAWRAAWQEDPSLALYGPDGFHPSPLGTYLAAIVMYHWLSTRPTPVPPSRLTSTHSSFPDMTLTLESAALLGRAATRAIVETSSMSVR